MMRILPITDEPLQAAIPFAPYTGRSNNQKHQPLNNGMASTGANISRIGDSGFLKITFSEFPVGL